MKAGIPDTLVFSPGRGGGVLFCFLCLCCKISVSLCNAFPIKCKIHCRTGGFLKLYNYSAVTVLAGPQFPYNSSTVLTHYLTWALAKIQALEQLEP